MTTEDTKNPPVKKFRRFGIDATIWSREANDETFHTVTLSRSYKAQDGSWQRTNSYNAEQLGVLIEEAQKALKFLEELSDA